MLTGLDPAAFNELAAYYGAQRIQHGHKEFEMGSGVSEVRTMDVGGILVGSSEDMGNSGCTQSHSSEEDNSYSDMGQTITLPYFGTMMAHEASFIYQLPVFLQQQQHAGQQHQVPLPAFGTTMHGHTLPQDVSQMPFYFGAAQPRLPEQTHTQQQKFLMLNSPSPKKKADDKSRSSKRKHVSIKAEKKEEGKVDQKTAAEATPEETSTTTVTTMSTTCSSSSTSSSQSDEKQARTKAAPHVCPVENCGRSFSRRYNLRTHILTHYDVRQYRCEWKSGKCKRPCGKVFTRRFDLRRHSKVHGADPEEEGITHEYRVVDGITILSNSVTPRSEIPTNVAAPVVLPTVPTMPMINNTDAAALLSLQRGFFMGLDQKVVL